MTIKALAPMRLLICMLILLAYTTHSAAKPPLQRLDSGIEWLRGEFLPGRQPDGNSVLIPTPEGWILIDSGRHPEHRLRLLDRIDRSGQPLHALINTHWHLDHTGGNGPLRRRWPSATVYASDAIEAALRGFLANYRSDLEAAVTQSAHDPEQATAYRTEMARIDDAAALRPRVVVARGGNRRIGGRTLHLGLARNAATAADVWVYEPRSRTLISGDLVTLPVPFLDTACPRGWSRALERLSELPFAQLIPGHGAPLDRRQFLRYRRGFDALLECAEQGRTEQSCIETWLDEVGPLLDVAGRARVPELLRYYLEGPLRQSQGQHRTNCATD